MQLRLAVDVFLDGCEAGLYLILEYAVPVLLFIVLPLLSIFGGLDGGPWLEVNSMTGVTNWSE